MMVCMSVDSTRDQSFQRLVQLDARLHNICTELEAMMVFFDFYLNTYQSRDLRRATLSLQRFTEQYKHLLPVSDRPEYPFHDPSVGKGRRT
jgi:hypothetical protein